jgi:hypothetical protein
MPRRPKCERLARARPADHDLDAGAAQARVTDYPGLVAAERWMGGQRLPDGLVGGHARALACAVDRRGDQALLDAEQLGGGPAAFLERPVGDHADRPFGQEPVGQGLQLLPVGADQAGDHIFAGERGRQGSQPVRADEPVEYRRHQALIEPLVAVGHHPTGHPADEGVSVDAALGCLRSPPRVQGLRRHILLGLTGGVNGPLHQPWRSRSPLGLEAFDLGGDLLGPLGEHPQQLGRDALELTVAMPVRDCPLDTERAGQLPLVDGPVDRVRRPPMPVQVAAVQRRPPPIRALDAIGDHQMGVQQWIARAAGAVVEPDRQQPVAGNMLRPAVATPGAQVLIQVGDGLSKAGVVGGQHRPSGRLIAQPVQD